MNRIIRSIATLALLSGTAIAGAAIAQHASPMPEMDKKGMDMDMKMLRPIPDDPSSTAGYKSAMMKMMMDMPKFTGDADIDFMKQMRPHHQAAIDMAQVLIASGKDDAAKRLAAAIVVAQKREIATIDAWLKKKSAE
jgi:uncharacterized protein (DUF305 family)